MKGKEKKRRGQMGRKEDLEKRKRGGKERKRTQTNPYSNSISTFRVKTELVNGRTRTRKDSKFWLFLSSYAGFSFLLTSSTNHSRVLHEMQIKKRAEMTGTLS